MANKYSRLLKELRLERGLSQSEAAGKLGISRQSYMAVEKGARDLELPEAEKLCDVYGISIEELTAAVLPKYEKYKEMVLAFLQIFSSNLDGRIPKTKLAKLVYLADFAWYYEKLESMSGMQYLKLNHGPVPYAYFRALDELESEGKINIDHKGDMMLVGLVAGAKRYKLKSLNEEEKELIKKISYKWRGKRTQEIVNFTHEQLPYKLCTPNETIPYELITQEDPENVY